MRRGTGGGRVSWARAIWPTNGPVRPPLTTGRKVVIAPLLPRNYTGILSASLINNNVFASGDATDRGWRLAGHGEDGAGAGGRLVTIIWATSVGACGALRGQVTPAHKTEEWRCGRAKRWRPFMAAERGGEGCPTCGAPVPPAKRHRTSCRRRAGGRGIVRPPSTGRGLPLRPQHAPP